jgi:hypothetical protein
MTGPGDLRAAAEPVTLAAPQPPTDEEKWNGRSAC